MSLHLFQAAVQFSLLHLSPKTNLELHSFVKMLSSKILLRGVHIFFYQDSEVTKDRS